MLFTTETAAAYARKRWTAEREAKLKPRILPAPCDELTANPIQDELARTRKQIEALNDLLDDCTDAREQDALTRAKERLFRIWAHLAQLPGPGQMKPSAARPQSRRMPEPIPVATPLHIVSDSSQAVEPKQ